ncbi:MAG TPA: UDP-glucose/GDP-mannose dehydrogenase family protein, partial [Fibrobacteria bacterium]|nr:UDP-glucose/GDP-mannose dehydrogenase family protein [Fibrobacteria bacterium]
MRVSIAGTGYVGLVTGACLAEKGHEVTCVDLDAAKVETINRGLAPIREEGLDLLLLRHAGRGLKASTDLAEAVRRSELTLIAVGTPFDGRAIDLAQVKEAARAIGAALREKDAFHTVVVKSTVVPGTTDEVVLPILERESGKRAGMGFGVGMNPEFLTEGEAVSDFMDPDRLVLGAGDPRALKALEKLYAGFPGVPVVRTNPKTAEMIKYASNTLLATLISWSNELANLSQALGGIDAMEVVEGMKLSRYLTPAPAATPSGWVPAGPEDSPNASLAPAGAGAAAPIAAFLVPGCGFGGSCLPKDTAALIAHGKAAGVPMRVLEAVRDVNLNQPARMAKLLERRIPDLRGVPVAVLGLAFRPGTGDLRESPAIPIVRDLLAKGADVVAYDPAVAEEMAALGAPESHPASRLFDGQARLAFSLEEALINVRA